MSSPHRNEQLEQLANQFASIHKTIVTKYGAPKVPVTPVLSKVVIILGSEENVNIKRIATLLMISSGAATRHVDSLEEAGIAKRTMGLHDRREIIAELTSAGHELYQELRIATLKILEEVFQELQDTELYQLNGLLTKVTKTYLK